MRPLIPLIIFTSILLGCSNTPKLKNEKISTTKTKEKTDVEGLQELNDKKFRQVADFPTIKDSAQFINELIETFDLAILERTKQEQITIYKKIKLYGSDNNLFFIEYDWKAGSMFEYPWKYQLLLTNSGKLIHIFSGQRFDFVTIFNNENPFLLIVCATAKGTGWHEIYKISSDTVEDVYDGYKINGICTYDAHDYISVFKPYELSIIYIDNNRDGINDIIFSGEKLLLRKYTDTGFWYEEENGKPFSVDFPADRTPVQYIFLYDKPTGHFKAKETYLQDH